MKRLLFFSILFIASATSSLAQNRSIARGAVPGELYLTGSWYGIYNGYGYSTLRTALYHITENGKKLTIQYDADAFANENNPPGTVMIPQHILADATSGVAYMKCNYSKNGYAHTSLWVSFDYGKNWIFREENIGSNGYYAANVEGLIYRAYYIFYESLDYGFTFSEIDYGPGGSEPGLQNGEGFSVWYTSNKLLRYSNDFGNTFIEFPIDEQFVFGQIWGVFPDVYRGGLPGEVYVSSMFPEENYKATYKVSFSADTGHTFRHVYVSEQFDTQGSLPVFMSDREQGVFYIVKGYAIEDLNPAGHHTKVCIEYYRDYGETLVATYCHDLHKNYGKTCESVNDLVSEKCGNNCVLLSWSEPVSSLPVEEYRIYRNKEFLIATTNTTFLDENLLVGDYEYYVVTHYEMGCVSDSSNNIMVEIELGIKEVNELESVKLYPNPTDGQLIIDNRQLLIENVEIYDIYGRKLLEQKAESRKQKAMDISHLNAGIYFVRVITEKGTVTKKIVKF